MSREQTNTDRLEHLQVYFEDALAETLHPGWYGAIVITIPIQDGVVQHSWVETNRCESTRPDRSSGH
jgi:hypothetical protein